MKNSKMKEDVADDCPCVKIIGHLESVKWPLYPRKYWPSPGCLALADWRENSFIWLYYVRRSDGELIKDDVLLSKDSCYWDIHDVQRYFLGNLHCEEVLFTYQYPSLKMKTALGTHFWKINTAPKLPPTLYQKELQRAIKLTMKNMIKKEEQLDRLIISDQLVWIDKLDYFKRKTFFRLLCDVIRAEINERLEETTKNLISNLQYSPHPTYSIKELPHHLGYCSIKSIDHLLKHCLEGNYFLYQGSGQYIYRPNLKQTFLRSLGELTNLRILAIEYSHLADGTGAALLTLLPVIKVSYFRLQLMCREEHIPGQVDASLGVGGYDIPDSAWRRVTIACPDLYLFLAFFCIRDYDNVRRFLTPSMPVHEVHLQIGINLKIRHQQDSDFSCFFRHIAHQYGSTLVKLSVHQWRSAIFPLRRVFECLPRLSHFTYIGRVQDDVELRAMLTIVACGVCSKLKQLKILVQDDGTTKMYWSKTVHALNDEFSDIMKLYEVKFYLETYKQ